MPATYIPQPPQMSNPNQFGMTQNGNSFSSIPMANPSPVVRPMPRARVAPMMSSSTLSSGPGVSGNATTTGGAPSSYSYPMSGGQPRARASSSTAPGMASPQQNPGAPNALPDGSMPMSAAYSNTSPMGSRQQIDLAIRAEQAGDRAQANPLAGQSPNQPMTLDEDTARTMYHAMTQANPGTDMNQEFMNTMRDHYKQDGAALLNKWTKEGTLGQPVATMQNRQSAGPIDQGALDNQGNLSTANGPISKYGTFSDGRPHVVSMPNGDEIMTDSQGRRVGNPVGHQAPSATTAPQWSSGVKPQPGTMVPMLDGSMPMSTHMPPAPADIAPGMTPPGWTPAQTAEMTRLRSIDADNPHADAAARMATLPVSNRERFDAGVDVATAAANAANQPRVNYNVRTGGNTPATPTSPKPGPATKPSGPPQIRPADRVAAFKATENLRVVDQQTGKTRKLNTDERQHEVDRMLGGGTSTTQPSAAQQAGDTNTPDLELPDGATSNHDGSITRGGKRYVKGTSQDGQTGWVRAQ